jgi:pyridoxal 5'-phosphate synthase pdxT subunit
MVKKVSIGVLGIQGAISEHIASMTNALKETNTSGEVFFVKYKKEIDDMDALILPGGESTTISKNLYKSDLHDAIIKRIEENSLPIMGTCAGCVLLAKELVDNNKDLKLLHAMDMQVERNAFGRQRESFEKNIDINGFSSPYTAVFIRAPLIKKVWGKCKILAEMNKKIVMARQDKFLALSFHPELTDDLRIHKYFLDMIA